MAYGIEPAHAGHHIADAAGNRECKVDIPERLRGLSDTRCQLGVLDRARGFRPVQLHAADAEHWQYRNREDDDTHAAEPL